MNSNTYTVDYQDTEFTHDGIDFKVYFARSIHEGIELYVEGGDHDDWFIRTIVDADTADIDAEYEITITDEDMSKARNYLKSLESYDIDDAE